MSFRRRLEQADSESQAKQFEESQRTRRENEARRENSWLEKQNRDNLKAEEKQWFNQAVMPIFREVAAVKRVPIGRRISGIFGGFRSGFDNNGNSGRLVWNVIGGELTGRTSRWGQEARETRFWDELYLLVQNWDGTGDFRCQDYNITSREGVELLENYVIQLLTSGGTRRSDESQGEGLNGHF